MKPIHGYSDDGGEADSPRLTSEQSPLRPFTEFILELHIDVERKFLALGQPLWANLLSRKPDGDGNRFVEAMGPKGREQVFLPERPPGVRVGTAKVAFANLSVPLFTIRYAGIFDSEGDLVFSGAIIPTGKALIYCLPSVARVRRQGLLLDGDSRSPKVAPGEAAVRRVFADYVAGITTFEIAAELNSEGIELGAGTEVTPEHQEPR